MKYAFLLTCLLTGTLYLSAGAQDKEEDLKRKTTRTEYNFNLQPYALNHRHETNLGNGNKMIIELFDANDYDLLQNTDSLFRIFYRDLDQFKDSLELAPSGNIRIDYLYSVNNFQAIRFKRYAADGDQYVNRKGVLSRLKLEQDTVRLLIGKNLDSRKKSLIRYTPVQITFILNNYTDLRRITDSSGFRQMISVLAKASKPDQQYNNLYRHRTTIQYKPTAGKDSLNLRKGLYYGDEYNHTHYWTAGSSTLSFTGNIGVGLVKDRLSPMAELRAEVATPWGFGGKQRTVFSLSTTPYFFFDNNSTQVNWFLNAAAGSVHNGNLERSSFSSLEFGAGYLLKPVGNMFKGTTGKIFMNIGLPKNFSISPELIFTDNLRQVFPGITFKVFP